MLEQSPARARASLMCSVKKRSPVPSASFCCLAGPPGELDDESADAAAQLADFCRSDSSGSGTDVAGRLSAPLPPAPSRPNVPPPQNIPPQIFKERRAPLQHEASA